MLPLLSALPANRAYLVSPQVMNHMLLEILLVVFFLLLYFVELGEPTETRAYAFTRNYFALVSIGMLMFRGITALQKAQNRTGVKMTSDNCDWGVVSEDHILGLLLAKPNNTDMSRSALYVKVTKEVIQGSGQERTQAECEPEPGCPPEDIQYVQPYYQALFCQSSVSLKDYRSFANLVTYHIEVRSMTNNSIVNRDMPDFWISNEQDFFPPPDLNSSQFERRCRRPFDGHAAWLYMPSWRLNPGYHIEAEAQLVTRRFITSSFIHDVLLNSEPDYAHISLYPIVESGASALSNYTLATATLRVTLKPAYGYLRNSVAYHNIYQSSQEPTRKNELCTFIQEYREGSMFDVLGSIGGLFALLQAAHVLLFGRPMLWGLTGAKLITPFGLLGICSSRDFKRRLRERYHREPTRENPETLRVGEFLRDFVIELGPADIEPDNTAETSLETEPPFMPIPELKELPDCQGPLLLSIGTRKIPIFEKREETLDSFRQANDAV
ncbi:hypothetical protein RHS02_00979, partial [Rhizoctonia solani]